MQSQTIRRVTSTQTAFSLHSHATRHLAAHSSRPWLRLLYPCLALFLSLTLLAGLSGCGPASSDNAPSLGPRASVAGPPLSEQSPSPRKDPLPQTANPGLSAPITVIGATSGEETRKNGLPELPVSSPKSASSGDTLVVPAWMVKELESPDIGTRLRALETWAQSASPGAVDPLILAFEDPDERVRARAMELIEQDRVRAANAVE